MALKEKKETKFKKVRRTIKKKNDSYLNEIFSINETVSEIISSVVSLPKNIIFTASANCDKSIIAAYIKNHLENKNSACVIENINNKIDFSKYKVFIIPDSGINGLVKAFEYIVSGYDGFCLGLSLKYNENVIENLQTLIAIHNSNLSLKHIDNIISAAGSVLINFDKNDDGTYVVKNIDEIVKSSNEISLKTLFSEEFFNKTKKSEGLLYKPSVSSIQESVKLKQENQDDFNIEKTIVETEKETIEDGIALTETSQTNEEALFVGSVEKKNKYKLLKEKIKNKKMIKI